MQVRPWLRVVLLARDLCNDFRFDLLFKGYERISRADLCQLHEGATDNERKKHQGKRENNSYNKWQSRSPVSSCWNQQKRACPGRNLSMLSFVGSSASAQLRLLAALPHDRHTPGCNIAPCYVHCMDIERQMQELCSTKCGEKRIY